MGVVDFSLLVNLAGSRVGWSIVKRKKMIGSPLIGENWLTTPALLVDRFRGDVHVGTLTCNIKKDDY